MIIPHLFYKHKEIEKNLKNSRFEKYFSPMTNFI
jgi:hypothetical protein